MGTIRDMQSVPRTTRHQHNLCSGVSSCGNDAHRCGAMLHGHATVASRKLPFKVQGAERVNGRRRKPIAACAIIRENNVGTGPTREEPCVQDLRSNGAGDAPCPWPVVASVPHLAALSWQRTEISDKLARYAARVQQAAAAGGQILDQVQTVPVRPKVWPESPAGQKHPPWATHLRGLASLSGVRRTGRVCERPASAPVSLSPHQHRGPCPARHWVVRGTACCLRRGLEHEWCAAFTKRRQGGRRGRRRGSRRRAWTQDRWRHRALGGVRDAPLPPRAGRVRDGAGRRCGLALSKGDRGPVSSLCPLIVSGPTVCRNVLCSGLAPLYKRKILNEGVGGRLGGRGMAAEAR